MNLIALERRFYLGYHYVFVIFAFETLCTLYKDTVNHSRAAATSINNFAHP
jgi:hypothetical protein